MSSPEDSKSIVTVETFIQGQTDKLHIVDLVVPGVEDTYYRCYCSFDRRYEPEERTLDLNDENVCDTCASGYIRDSDTEVSADDLPQTLLS